MSRRRIVALFALWALVISPALAAVASDDELIAALGRVESGGSYGVVNGYGYAGKFQFGVDALTSAGWISNGAQINGNNYSQASWTSKAAGYGVGSLDDFLGNPAAQEAAMRDSLGLYRSEMARRGLGQYVGTNFMGQSLTEQEIMAMMHHAGPAGAQALLEGKLDAGDGMGTTTAEYLARLRGEQWDGTGFAGDAGGLAQGGGLSALQQPVAISELMPFQGSKPQLF